MTDANVERVARALYEHWVAENFNEEWASWDRLGDKETWRDRARAAIAALRADEGGPGQ